MGRFVFKLPDVGEGTAEAELVAWHVAVGDRVSEDQHLVDVMTDKATVEITAPVSGIILALRGTPGEMAVVGAPLVEFDIADATSEEPSAAPKAEPQTEPRAEPAPSAVPDVVCTDPACPAPKKALAAPAVRLRAADLGIDLATIAGSGPGGRVTHGDLDDHLAGAPKRPAAVQAVARNGVEEIKITGLRRKIAEKMSEAKRRIPHFTYVDDIDMTELEALRAHLNAQRGARGKLTVLPFFMRAVVNALPLFPQMNAHFDDAAGLVKRFAAAHIGIATDTPAGLMVPVVRHAESLDLWQTASALNSLAEKARSGKASREELTGSTITITSLGPLGGLAATPIINLPEVAILAPNAIVERPAVVQGQLVARKMMNLSSAYDHRVVDGADAARFVKAIKEQLEHPALLFMGG